jgi:hypothetical protein
LEWIKDEEEGHRRAFLKRLEECGIGESDSCLILGKDVFYH